MSIFTLYSLGKATTFHDVALETAPVNNANHYAKSKPDNAEFFHFCKILQLYVSCPEYHTLSLSDHPRLKK